MTADVRPGAVNVARHLVITGDGIRTFGNWQERLETLLNAEAGARNIQLSVVNYKYVELPQ